jgi:hypothetical protein
MVLRLLAFARAQMPFLFENTLDEPFKRRVGIIGMDSISDELSGRIRLDAYTKRRLCCQPLMSTSA